MLSNPDLHLIAATPWPGFARRWNDEWKEQYNALLHQADLTVNVCDHYHQGVFQQRNVWMVDRSNRVIAYYNGSAGGTRNTIEYAEKKGIEVYVLEDVSPGMVNYSFEAEFWKNAGLKASEKME